MRERERELGPVWAVSKRRLKENEKKKIENVWTKLLQTREGCGGHRQVCDLTALCESVLWSR